MSGPGWNDVLRYPAGSLLRADFTLKSMLRDALQARLGQGSWQFALPASATLRMHRLDAGGFQLTCQQDGLNLTLKADCDADGGHVLDFSAMLGEQQHRSQLNRVVLQTAGPREAYVAFDNERGRLPFLHLRYARSGDDATLSLITAAFREHVPEKQRAWLPGELEFARLQRLYGDAP